MKYEMPDYLCSAQPQDSRGGRGEDSCPGAPGSALWGSDASEREWWKGKEEEDMGLAVK